MAKAPQRPPGGDDPDAADAELLFRDEAPRKSPTPAAKPPVASPGAGDYELAGDEPEEVEPVAPIPVPNPAAAPRPKKTEAESRAKKAPAQVASVDEVWSRGAEWGGTLALLAVVALIVAVLVYKTFSVDNMTLSFFILLVGVAVLIVLSYPLMITLERPVRMTPEQAVKDYFAALSRYFPHYKRMWLLLSSAGRTSGSFDSFSGFKKYWKDRLAELKQGRAKGSTPLIFRVESFKSEKSAGLTALDAKYTINVFLPSKEGEKLLESFRIQSGLVKGPDKMWYLNQGTLPAEAAKTTA